MWFCGLSAVTSASRTLYAFARDGGLPASPWLRRVSVRHRIPHVAVLVCLGAVLAVGLVSAALSDDQFLAVASLATTALYVSYVIPVALGAIARHQGRWTRTGVWHLGRYGQVVACVAVLWTVFVLAVTALPHHGAYLGLLVVIAVVLGVVYRLFVAARSVEPRRVRRLGRVGRGPLDGVRPRRGGSAPWRSVSVAPPRCVARAGARVRRVRERPLHRARAHPHAGLNPSPSPRRIA